MAQSKAKKAGAKKARKSTLTTKKKRKSTGVTPSQSKPGADDPKITSSGSPAEGQADTDPRGSHAQEDEEFRANQEVTEETAYEERDRFPD